MAKKKIEEEKVEAEETEEDIKIDVEVPKEEARKVFEAMYYSDDIPFLKRKKDKFDRQWNALEQSRIGERPAGFRKGGSIMRIA